MRNDNDSGWYLWLYNLSTTFEYGLGASYSDESSEDKEETQEQEPLDPRLLLTPEQVQQFKDIFTAIDIQGNGTIPTKLMGIIVRTLGFNPTKAQVKQYMSKADPEGKGLMDFQGFILPLAEIIDTVPETLEDILLAFRTLDENDLQYFTRSQLYTYLTTLGESLEDFEIDLFMKTADPKGEGKIWYEDFLERVMGTPKKKSNKGGNKKRKK